MQKLIRFKINKNNLKKKLRERQRERDAKTIMV